MKTFLFIVSILGLVIILGQRPVSALTPIETQYPARQTAKPCAEKDGKIVCPP